MLRANRDRPELRNLLGYLPSPDELRVEPLASAGFRETLRRVHDEVSSTYAEESHTEGPIGESWDALFNFVPAIVSEHGAGALSPRSTATEWVLFPARSTAWGVEFDIELFERGSGSVDAVLSYNARFWDAETARRFASGFSWLVARVVGDADVLLPALRSAMPPPGTRASALRGSP